MTFDPRQHGFMEMDFTFPAEVAVFEYELEGIDQAKHDMMRLNAYLSRDGDFVTVWWGLLDATMTEMKLDYNDPDFRFKEQYEEPLFRGYIADDDVGSVILKALRLDGRLPNILSMTEDGKLECHTLKAATSA